jgi:hypothetical protein
MTAAASVILLLNPVSITVDAKSDLTSKNKRADYVIITTDALMEGAEGLATYRGAEFDVEIVNITDIYDEFAFGEPYPYAIQDFVAATRSWKTVPAYFAIVGDGSLDYQNRLGAPPEYNHIPPMLWGSELGLHPSDTLLGDPDDSGKPVVAFGRIPAKLNQDVLNYVGKLATYETSVISLPSLLLTDRPDAGGDFKLSGLAIAGAVEGDQIILDMANRPTGEVRDELFGFLDSGISLMNYIGHGGIGELSKSGILGNADADINLTNTDTPAFVGLSCLVNNFSIPGFDGLGERLVGRADAAMVASWAASGESYNSAAEDLGVTFNNRYSQYTRLGEAIVDTLSTTPDGLITVYTLLGDPALKLHQGL